MLACVVRHEDRQVEMQNSRCIEKINRAFARSRQGRVAHALILLETRRQRTGSAWQSVGLEVMSSECRNFRAGAFKQGAAYIDNVTAWLVRIRRFGGDEALWPPQPLC